MANNCTLYSKNQIRINNDATRCKQIKRMNSKENLVDNITINGMEVIVKPAATLDDWKDFGRKLKKIENHLQWHLGFWWNYGHEKWNGDAEEFAKELGYSVNTLKQYGYAERQVTLYNRLDDVSFSHHIEVAALSPKKQTLYLDKARDEGLSRDKLRKIIRQAERPEAPETLEQIRYAATEKRLATVKEIIDSIIKMMDKPIKTLIPQTMVQAELLRLKTEIDKFN